MSYWLWIFWSYSFFGWILERLFAAVTHSPRRQRRCLFFAPLCPVYGLGMTVVLALPAPLLTSWQLYFFGTLTTTAVEYLYHWAGELLFHVRFWDYTTVPGNLHSRICVPFSLVWGLLMFPAVRLAAPIAALANHIPAAFTWLCLMLFTADVVCTLRFLAVTHDLEAMRRAISYLSTIS